jgi:hypothetical protein
MSKIDFEARIEKARRYYELLNIIHFDSSEEWIHILQKLIEDNEAGLPELLVLIHPNWYENQIINIDDPRGNRSFPSAKNGVKCRSLEIYGYECFFKDQVIHIDHQFPYSKGGMTIHENAMYLCAEHNLSKSIDVHLIDWDSISTNWVSLILDKLIHEIRRDSKSLVLRYSKILDRSKR